MPTDQDETTRDRRLGMDGSLSAERAKVDSELAARSGAVQEDADAVVKLARERAQEVLRVARARADLSAAEESVDARARVARERDAEDRVRAAEQATSDAILTTERELRRQALFDLLAQERRTTDDALTRERAWADDMLQRRDDVLAMVNHDFMNLAASVAMNAATIVDEADEADARGRRIIGRADSIRRATSQMIELANNLLDVASINAGLLRVNLRAADATPMLRETLRFIEPIVAGKGLRLNAEIADGPLGAVFDDARLFEVLTNLLTNAVKFTKAPGVITLRATHVGSELEIAVSDTGCGIAANELTMIFDRFARARGTRVSGHGLGLYICKHFVAAHQGTLTAESAVGRGSTFRVRIPAAEVGSAAGRK